MEHITTPALESITFDVLTGVSGGCRRPDPPAPVTNVQQVQYVQQAAPVVMPVCACRGREPASVDSSVEINYGGQATTTV